MRGDCGDPECPGYAIFQVDRPGRATEVQRCDECAVFDSDEEASRAGGYRHLILEGFRSYVAMRDGLADHYNGGPEDGEEDP